MRLIRIRKVRMDRLFRLYARPPFRYNQNKTILFFDFSLFVLFYSVPHYRNYGIQLCAGLACNQIKIWLS